MQHTLGHWNLWKCEWNYEPQLVQVSRKRQFRLDYRPPLQWTLQELLFDYKAVSSRVVFQGTGRSAGNLQQLIHWGRDQWHNGSRRAVRGFNIQLTGSSEEQLRLLRPGSGIVATGRYKGPHQQGQVWAEPDGFGGLLCWLRKCRHGSGWRYGFYPAIPNRLYGGSRRCYGLQTEEEINEVIEGLLFEATSISKHESSISHLINAIRGEA